ncbi:MAG: hypothetical protein ACLP9D_00490 [Candidatus Bathyarchaeia archaeon]
MTVRHDAATCDTRGEIGECLIVRPNYPRPPDGKNTVTATPEEEDKVVEALEELRINYNLRQWRVCSLICESLADKFKSIANREK